MSNDSEYNEFTRIALQRVKSGEMTIESLEKKVEFTPEGAEFASTQKVHRGIRAALDILKQSA